MLDSDDDPTFESVFVDGGPPVDDKALIEGTTRVAHVIQTPYPHDRPAVRPAQRFTRSDFGS